MTVVETPRTICWQALWNDERPGLGLEQLQLSTGSARSVLLAFDDDAGNTPFALHYDLQWDSAWCVRSADLSVAGSEGSRTLQLRSDGSGHWQNAEGQPLPALDGCIDIDIWPTPFTNSFPIWRVPLAIGERREFRMAWVSAPALSVEAKPQAYTRLADRLYRFESLDGSGFQADLPVDADGLVLDYPGLFARIGG